MADRNDVEKERERVRYDWDRGRQGRGWTAQGEWNRNREQNRGEPGEGRDWDRERDWTERRYEDRSDWDREGGWTGETRRGQWQREDDRYGNRGEWDRPRGGEPGHARAEEWGRGGRTDWERDRDWGSREHRGETPDWARDQRWTGEGRTGGPPDWQRSEPGRNQPAWGGGMSRYGAGIGSYSGGMGAYSEQRGRHTGRGPKGYQRSDDRIREDVCERLTQHPNVDASEIDVQVNNGEVTLNGSVDDRHSKRMAEDIAEDVSGVREVHNQLKTQQHSILQAGERNR